MGLIGKSGSGKTTLIKCIYGLEDLHNGEINLNGETVTGPSYNLIPGHKNMSLVSQEYYVLDNHTVQENITDKLIGYTDEAKQKRVTQILNLLELNALRNTKARFLSSGQKQRVAIARALTIIPDLLLLDEPFSNLDRLLSEKLYAFINKEVKKKNTSVILITHQTDEALKYADRIGIVDGGKLIEINEKWEVYYNPKNVKLAGLLGEYNILKKSDFEKEGARTLKKNVFLRPDKITLNKTNSVLKIPITILHCSYNGKCYEVLAETKNGQTLLFYSNTTQPSGKSTIASVKN
ncbi:MAG: ABC transporter ATP-binding protein [Sphingobacteriaceae bacterium]|nr:ABC transporter ATP-binding protein [Sphingobacteriaceae bacterium]